MPQPHEKLAGLRVLVVEDELFVAMEIESILEALQCEIAGPVSRVVSALAVIEQDDRLDGVILDLNLGGETALPIAEKLLGKGVPFVLLTGYTRDSNEAAPLRDAHRLGKPFDRQRIADAMAEVFLTNTREP